MLAQMRKWWNQKDDTTARLAALELAQEQLSAELTEANKELGVFRKQEAEDQAKRDSKEPWVEIRSADYNEVKGFRIELDWNEAFIQHLKEGGIQGKTEEGVVQKWLAFLYQDLVEKLEQQIIDASDKTGFKDDFV